MTLKHSKTFWSKEAIMIKISSIKKEENLMDQITYLARIRESLVNDQIAKIICEDMGFEHKILTGIPIRFEDLDVSAKTVNSNISLNPKLMNKSFDIVMRYVIHELVHCFQHVKNFNKKKDNNSKDDEDYLDDKNEIEAFQWQIKYDEESRGEDEAEEYVDELLEYHDVPKKERDDKKELFLEKTD